MATATCRQNALCERKHDRCDCCRRMVHQLHSVGRDSAGASDGPNVCIVCKQHAPSEQWAINEGGGCSMEPVTNR